MKKKISILIEICCIFTMSCIKKDSSLNDVVEQDKDGNFYYIKAVNETVKDIEESFEAIAGTRGNGSDVIYCFGKCEYKPSTVQEAENICLKNPSFVSKSIIPQSVLKKDIFSKVEEGSLTVLDPLEYEELLYTLLKEDIGGRTTDPVWKDARSFCKKKGITYIVRKVDSEFKNNYRGITITIDGEGTSAYLNKKYPSFIWFYGKKMSLEELFYDEFLDSFRKKCSTYVKPASTEEFLNKGGREIFNNLDLNSGSESYVRTVNPGSSDEVVQTNTGKVIKWDKYRFKNVGYYWRINLEDIPKDIDVQISDSY